MDRLMQIKEKEGTIMVPRLKMNFGSENSKSVFYPISNGRMAWHIGQELED